MPSTATSCSVSQTPSGEMQSQEWELSAKMQISMAVKLILQREKTVHGEKKLEVPVLILHRTPVKDYQLIVNTFADVTVVGKHWT